MSRTRVPNPGADATDEIRERNRRAQLNLSVLMKGFGSKMQECYSHGHEEAEELLEEMNKQLPLAIKEAAEAYGAYAPFRRIARRRIARRKSVVN